MREGTGEAEEAVPCATPGGGTQACAILIDESVCVSKSKKKQSAEPTRKGVIREKEKGKSKPPTPVKNRK